MLTKSTILETCGKKQQKELDDYERKCFSFFYNSTKEQYIKGGPKLELGNKISKSWGLGETLKNSILSGLI